VALGFDGISLSQQPAHSEARGLLSNWSGIPITCYRYFWRWPDTVRQVRCDASEI